MKTIKEWYNELPEDVREKAINNTCKRLLSKRVKNVKTALFYGFSWIGSNEGCDYWLNVVEVVLKENN